MTPTPAQPNAKKRVLFVDDESMILEMYRVAFEGDRDGWNVEFCDGAPEALQMMDRAPFDVVVTDMRMPRMSGAELVVEVMKRHPQTSRLILSGYADQEQVARCIGATHQFLAKPLGLKALKTTISRVCSLDAWLGNETLKSLVAQMRTVPSIPSLYFRITEALARPECSIDEIGEIISSDPAMTAKILQLVNSAFFGIARRIMNPTEAVQFLGVGRIRSLVLSLHVFSCFDQVQIKDFSIEKVWTHSIATGQIAQKIAKMEKMERSVIDEAGVAAMLHDIGKVMLASSVPELYQKAHEIARERKAPLSDGEREVFGVSHAEVGAYLLGLWGLPVSIVEAIALHNEPGRSAVGGFTPLTVVHVCSVLEKEINDPAAAKDASGFDLEYLGKLGLKKRLDDWRDAAREALRQED